MIVTAHNKGLGVTGSQIVGSVGGTTGGLVGALTPLIFGAAAGPLGIAVGGMIAAGAALASVLGVGNGCGQSCIEASNYANQAEEVLRQNLASYQSGKISQSEAIANFDNVWSSVTAAWNQIGGAAGSNGIGDRQRGACKWKSNGQCWNWFIGYRDPLDVPNNTAVSDSSVTGNLVSGGSGISWGLIAIVGIGAVMVLSLGEK